jgi:hypothetical protein
MSADITRVKHLWFGISSEAESRSTIIRLSLSLLQMSYLVKNELSKCTSVDDHSYSHLSPSLLQTLRSFLVSFLSSSPKPPAFFSNTLSIADVMDTPMAQAAPVNPSRTLPTITIKRMLEMTTTTRRFKVELAITGPTNSNLAGEPVPYKTEWQHHLNITAVAQDSNGDEITIEVSNDDAAWMGQLSKRLALGKTVVIEQPSFSGCK